MILRRPIATIDEIDEIERYHVESAYVSSDDLSKRILRVKTDHGNEFGIRLEDDAPPLERGMVFEVGEGRLLAIETIPDKMLVVTPRTMDEMGHVAHYLGNLHKPVEVRGGRITLLYDPVVDKDLVHGGIPVEVVEMELDHPLRHIDLAKLAQGEHHHHHHPHEHGPDHFSHEHAHSHTYTHTHPHEHGPAGHHHHPHQHELGPEERHPVRRLEEDVALAEAHPHEHGGRLREDAAEVVEHHRERRDLREFQRDEWKELEEEERHRHVEEKVHEDLDQLGGHPHMHPVHRFEEDVEEMLEDHDEHREMRRLERDERWALDEAEHPHHHHAHPREDGR